MAGENVIDTTAASFETDVIEGSGSRPVLVDFWAGWCAPCKTLSPVLDELAADLDGGLLVAKVDTDAEGVLAGRFGIRSLPTMLLFVGGEPVRQIIGAQSKSTILDALASYLPRESDAVVEEALKASTTDECRAAIAKLRASIENEPDNYRLHAVLADLLIDVGDVDAAHELLRGLPANVACEDVFEPAHARIRLSQAVDASGEPGRDADEAELEYRYRTHVREALSGDYDGALDGLLELLASANDWRDGAARKAIVDVLTIMGDDARVKDYRKRLARALH